MQIFGGKYTRFLFGMVFLHCFSGDVRLQAQDTLNIDSSFLPLTHVSDDLGIYLSRENVHAIPSSLVNVGTREASTIEQYLQGAAAGVAAIQNSGQPGATSTIMIRGAHTINATGDPLFVIDGMPIYNETGVSAFASTLGPALSPLAYLNPSDIASISVLKDGAGTALYGLRGSNGVVIVRTKRATDNASNISLDVSLGTQNPIDKMELANGEQFASFLNEAYTNAGIVAPYGNAGLFGQGTDWQESILRKQALRQNYRLSFRGGDEKISFLVSGQYLSQDGIVIGSDLQRYSLHANIDADLSNKFKLTNSFNYGRLDANTISSASSADDRGVDVISGAMSFSPLLQHVNGDGTVNSHNFMVGSGGNTLTTLQSDFPLPNPLLYAAIADSKTSANYLTNVFRLDYSLTDHFSLDALVGVHGIFTDESTFIPGQLFYQSSANAIGTAAKVQSLQVSSQLNLKYDVDLGVEHHIDALLGFSTESYTREFLAGQSVGFDNETLRYYSLTVGKTKNLQSDLTKWGMQSFVGQINYSYKDKYTLGFAGRSDASSIVGGSHHFYPAVSLSWLLHEEPFIKEASPFSTLILRASYGVSGNLGIAPYSKYTVLDELGSSINGAPVNGIGLARIGSDGLEAEYTEKTNFGVHLGLKDSKFQMDLDFYRDYTANAFLSIPLAGNAGFETALVNGAEIVNTGVELSLSAQCQSAKFGWVSQLLVGYNRNDIMSVRDDLSIYSGDRILGIEDWSVLQSGLPIGTFYGYKSAGLVQSGESPASFAGQQLQPGDQKYIDMNGDGVINRDDRSVIGHALPDLSFGIYNTFRFKGLDLGILFQGTAGQDIANFNRLLTENPTGTSNVSIDYLSRAGNTLPIARRQSNVDMVFSDQIIENGSYLRLKNLTLGYEIPKVLLSKIAIGSCRVYITGENLLTLSGYSGVDPDVSHFGSILGNQGVDLGVYPKSKLFMAGVNVTF